MWYLEDSGLIIGNTINLTSELATTSLEIINFEIPHKRKTFDKNNTKYIKSKCKWWVDMMRETKDSNILTLLAINGPHVNGVDSMGNNLLFYMTKMKNIASARRLINLSIHINHKNFNGETSVSEAYLSNNEKLFDILVNRGGDVNNWHIMNHFLVYKRWRSKISMLILAPENLFHSEFNEVYMRFCKFSGLW